ncbi:hypothetical protein Tco_1086456, partial [Tanacetum coccineum]
AFTQTVRLYTISKSILRTCDMPVLFSAAIEGSDPVTGLPRSAVDDVISHDMNGCCSVMTSVLVINLVFD